MQISDSLQGAVPDIALREALWAIKVLRDELLPLTAAATMAVDVLLNSRQFATPLIPPMSLVGAVGVPVLANPADTLLLPLIVERRPVWRGRPHVNGCAVPAAVVE